MMHARRTMLTLSLILTVLGLPLTGQSTQNPTKRTLLSTAGAASITTAGDLVRAMHDRYAGAWYSSLTFTQRTVNHLPDGTVREQTWREFLKVPGSLRIEMGHPDSGNGALFVRDSVFVFRGGVRRAARPLIHSLLVLGFDVYGQPAAGTMAKVAALQYDTTRFHEDVWQGRPAFVVGAAKGDSTSKQFWVDQERLVFVRSLERSPHDSTVLVEAQFNGYERAGGGWVAATVLFFEGGRLSTEEHYSDIRVDAPIPDRLFDTTRWR